MTGPTPIQRLETVRRCLVLAAKCGDGDARDALADLDAALADLGKAAPAPRRNASGPSHLTKVQAAALLGVSRQAVVTRIKRGTLPVETHHGLPMIPTWAILQALDKKKGGAK